jgi:hypothetical protein
MGKVAKKIPINCGICNEITHRGWCAATSFASSKQYYYLIFPWLVPSAELEKSWVCNKCHHLVWSYKRRHKLQLRCCVCVGKPIKNGFLWKSYSNLYPFVYPHINQQQPENAKVCAECHRIALKTAAKKKRFCCASCKIPFTRKNIFATYRYDGLPSKLLSKSPYGDFGRVCSNCNYRSRYLFYKNKKKIENEEIAIPAKRYLTHKDGPTMYVTVLFEHDDVNGKSRKVIKIPVSTTFKELKEVVDQLVAQYYSEKQVKGQICMLDEDRLKQPVEYELHEDTFEENFFEEGSNKLVLHLVKK